MKISKYNGDLTIEDIEDFDILQTLECGQFFRYSRQGDVFTVRYRDKCRRIKQNGGSVVFFGCDEQDDVVSFFDLSRDYGAIIRKYSELGDPYIGKASAFGHGIRILKQDPFEALISFIISQNNNIPRIQGIIERLCDGFGRDCDGGKAFPTVADLEGISESDLAPIRCGFRAKYIVDAVRRVSSGEIKLEEIADMDYESAKAELMKIKGVGEKVANCSLLFGFGFLSAFPVDVWIKRTIDCFYGDGFDPSIFGDTAGIAQQYLFYYARKNKLI